ncbi:MATE family efflux transporter [Spirochaetota bacterium]
MTIKNNDHFFDNLFRIALPIALQNLAISSVNMLDTIMVGRLGARELASVGLANQIWFLLMLFMFGSSTGAGVFIAQFWGKKDIKGIKKTAGLSMTISLCASLLFMLASLLIPKTLISLYSKDPEVIRLGAIYLKKVAISYPITALSFSLSLTLRSVEQVRLPMAATVVSLFINALFNYILIFGKLGFPAMGVAGAAYATVLARFVETLIVLAGAYAIKSPPAGKLRELSNWDWPFVSRFTSIAAPVILNEILWSLGITVYNAIMARVGTNAIAAFNVTNTISQLAMVIFMGSANAAAIMIGKRIGEGEISSAFDWAKRFAVLSPVFGIAVGLLVVPSAFLLPYLFFLEAEPLRQAARMVFVLAAVIPVKAFNLHMIVGICRAGGDTKFGAFFDLFGVWFVGIPLGLLGAFVFKLEPWLVFFLFYTDELSKSGLGIWRLVSKRWLNDVTK